MEKLLCFGQGVHFYQISSFKYTSLGMCVSLLKHLLLHKIYHRIGRGRENCSSAGIKSRHQKKKVASYCKAYMGGTGQCYFSFLVLC